MLPNASAVTVVALLGTSSLSAAPRARSIVHQMSHTQWPLIIQPASFSANKAFSINLDMLSMLDTCADHLPCLIVDGDVHFHRNIRAMLHSAIVKLRHHKKIDALHLCPGCIYNRITVHKTGNTWGNYPPEQRIMAQKDYTGSVYTSIPFPTCWYGGPVAVLFSTQEALNATSNAIKQSISTPIDVIFTSIPGHVALVNPLCREAENNIKDRL